MWIAEKTQRRIVAKKKIVETTGSREVCVRISLNTEGMPGAHPSNPKSSVGERRVAG